MDLSDCRVAESMSGECVERRALRDGPRNPFVVMLELAERQIAAACAVPRHMMEPQALVASEATPSFREIAALGFATTSMRSGSTNCDLSGTMKAAVCQADTLIKALAADRKQEPAPAAADNGSNRMSDVEIRHELKRISELADRVAMGDGNLPLAKEINRSAAIVSLIVGSLRDEITALQRRENTLMKEVYDLRARYTTEMTDVELDRAIELRRLAVASGVRAEGISAVDHALRQVREERQV